MAQYVRNVIARREAGNDASESREAALARGVKVTGATAHLVNLGVDEGPILLQKAVDVLPGDTPETLQKRVMEEAEWKLLPAAVDMVCQWAEEEETL